MINPLDNDALRELEKIAIYYHAEGEKFSRTGNTDQALKYYRLAQEVRPNDTSLSKKIEELEEY